MEKQNQPLQAGLKAELVEQVSQERTAQALGSGGLPVYSTPSMVTLMEKASLTAVAPYLPEGCSTVGTALDIRHCAASPVGAQIHAQGILTKTDGRRLTFDVRAWDEYGTIGEGTHERFIVDNEKFVKKANAGRQPGSA